MTLDEIEAGKHGEHLHKVINTLAKSTWGMSVAQLAQSARLSVKTVHKVLKDNPTHFNDKEGVYTLRGQKVAPITESSLVRILIGMRWCDGNKTIRTC